MSDELLLEQELAKDLRPPEGDQPPKPETSTALEPVEPGEDAGGVLLTLKDTAALPMETRQKLELAVQNSMEMANYVADNSSDSVICNAYFRKLRDKDEWRLTVKSSAAAIPALMETATLTFQQPIRLANPDVEILGEEVRVRVNAKKFAIGVVGGKMTELEINSQFGLATEALKDFKNDVDMAIKAAFSKARRDAVHPLIPIAVHREFFKRAMELGKVEVISLQREKNQKGDWYTVQPPDIYEFTGIPKPAGVKVNVRGEEAPPKPQAAKAKPVAPASSRPGSAFSASAHPVQVGEPLASTEQIGKLMKLAQDPPIKPSNIDILIQLTDEWGAQEIPPDKKRLTKSKADTYIKMLEERFRATNTPLPY